MVITTTFHQNKFGIAKYKASPYAGGVQVGSPEPPFKINDIHSMHVVEVLVYTVESQLSELQLSKWVS